MRTLQVANAIREAMLEELKRDPNVVLMGEDVAAMGSSLGTSTGFKEMFGTERIIDTPICESGQASFALGMAMAGKRVILEYMMADFQAYAFDGLVNQLAKQRYISGGLWKYSVTVRMPHGAGIMVGAHHSQSVDGWYTNVPGLKIVAPTTSKDVFGLLKASVRGDDPVIILEPKFALGIPGELPDSEEDYVGEFGKANLVREGKDVTVISYQYALACAQDAASDLEDDIDCEIIDLVSLIPYDKDAILRSVKKTGRVVIAHESPLRGGFGGEIAAFIAENAFADLKAPIVRVGSKNTPIPYGPSEEFVMISTKDIKKAIRKVMAE
jgi:acetoin:2,6-dichlorophenolindophenol oxidoreductase subunit beta